MKTIRLIIYSLLVTAVFYACKKTDHAAPTTTGEKIKVNVQVSGDITTTTSPINNGRKSGSNGANAKTIYDSTLYAVDVRIGGQPYAAGVFNTTNSFILEVPKGTQYVVNVAAFRKGTSIGMYWSATDGDYYYYADPINRGAKNEMVYASNVPISWEALDPSFLDTLSYILVTSDVTTGANERNLYSELDSYYASDTYMSADSGTTLNISLKRISFGINYKIHNLTDGFLVASYDGLMSPKVITDTTGNNLHIYTADAFRWNDSLNVTPVHVSLMWQHTDGITQALGDKYIYPHRNQLTTVNVTIPDKGSPGNSGKASISIGTLDEPWAGNNVVNF